MTQPLWQLSGSELVAGIRAGQFTCSDAVTSAVARMRQCNPTINAITLDLGDPALDAAAELDRRLARGEAPGPLCGVPVTIKDNVDVAGQRTPNGLPALANAIAPDDAPLVAHLKRAGAVIIGRTNTPEFSMRAFTDNPLYGLTRNPWSDRHNCGGSSGGAGASLAAGIGAIAHGNDIGGSIRIPAYHCGVCGIKPSLGRIPHYAGARTPDAGVVARFMSAQGPLARSVADLRLALAVMAQPDARDPWYVPAPLTGPALARPVRVALVRAAPGVATHHAVAAALDDAAEFLRGAGYVVEEGVPPDADRTRSLGMRLLATDLKYNSGTAIATMGSPTVQRYFEETFEIGGVCGDMAEYMTLLGQRTRLMREWDQFLDRYPLALTPLSLQPPFEVDYDLKGIDYLRAMWVALTFSITMNVMSLPAAAVPVRLHDGLPIGVQLVGRRYREDTILAAAEAIEGRVGVFASALWHREA
jgi:amidase